MVTPPRFIRIAVYSFPFAAAAAAGGLLSDTTAAPAASSPDGPASYHVTFVPTWNPATHPFEYPHTHAKQGLLTPIIGATHNADYRVFAPGMRPTPGLERLSERGEHAPLDREIRAAIEKGRAGALIEFADGSPGPVHPAVMGTFEVRPSQPMISLVGMIAPSPDWFFGVSSVDLRAGGDWAASMVVTAYAWDSGGDGGTTYMAEDADLDPKGTTRKADTPHFVCDGKYRPVGAFVFKRIPRS